MQRRGFLAGILAAGFAPAAIGSGVLMPIKKIQRLPWTTQELPGVVIVNPRAAQFFSIDDFIQFDGVDQTEVGSLTWDSSFNTTILTIKDLHGNVILQSGPDISALDILTKRMRQGENSHRAFCLTK